MGRGRQQSEPSNIWLGSWVLGPPDVLDYATLNLQGRILGIGLSIRVGILYRLQVCSRDDLIYG